MNCQGGCILKLDEFRKHGEISPDRKLMFYGGMALTVIGFILFLIPFFTIISSMGSFSQFGAERFGSSAGSFIWAVIGMILIVAGQFLRSAGAKGLAGSGVVLDPQRAREELSPYSEAIGGMVRDAVAGFKEGEEKSGEMERTKVMVRCINCRALNDEAAKYCSQCGKAL